MDYPKKRRLDGVLFRVKRSDHFDDRFENVCFTDLTQQEQDMVTAGRDLLWFKNMVFILAYRLREVGDELDLWRESND